MRTSKYIKLHERALSVLEMIVKANNAAERCRFDLARFRAKSKWDREIAEGIGWSEGGILKDKTKYECISLRLQKWYADILQRLTSETKELIQPEETVNIGTVIFTPEQTKEMDEEVLRINIFSEII